MFINIDEAVGLLSVLQIIIVNHICIQSGISEVNGVCLG